MSGHTPGPWHVHEYGHPIVFDEARLKTADCNSLRPKAENVANARLVAATPDLLAAAKVSLLIICALLSERGKAMHPNMVKDVEFAIEANRAAIAKATTP